jgi:tetratricopeptide (TPR) repeat protein/DNA-binding winged helix-turn-helix (wHTH) protein
MRIVLHDRVVDLDNGRVRGGTPLTQFECTIVRYLYGHSAQAVSRDRLLVDVWRYPKPVATRCVDTAMRRIRQKIEEDAANPRHLLTVVGEGYRWWDDGAAAVTQDDQCLGRTQWSEQLAWAETTFGLKLDPHDPRVGLSKSIRAAFEEETSAMSAEARGLIDLLSLSAGGWTPTELSEHSNPTALRRLVQHKWVDIDGTRARLAALWWPVRTQGRAAREVAVRLWMERFRSKQAVDLAEVLPAVLWPELQPDQAAELLSLAYFPLLKAGLFQHLTQACDALLAYTLSPELHCRMRLCRCGGLYNLGLFAESRREAEAALVAAKDAPVHLADAMARCATLAHVTGDLAGAAEAYPPAIEATRHPLPRLSLLIQADYARVLWDLGLKEGAVEACRAARAAALIGGQEQPRLHAEKSLGRMLLGMGEYAEAHSRLTRLYEHYVVHGPTGDAAETALDLSLAHLEHGRVDECDVWLARALEHALAAERHTAEGGVYGAMGYAAGVRGAWQEANAAQHHAISIFQDTQQVAYTLAPRCWVAVGARQTGELALSEAMLQSALGMLRPDTAASGRSLAAIACQVLGVDGPELPSSAEHSLLARIARRAWSWPPDSEGKGDGETG